jgi:hypothetical protein
MFQEFLHVGVWFVGVDDGIWIGIASVHAEKSGVGANIQHRSHRMPYRLNTVAIIQKDIEKGALRAAIVRGADGPTPTVNKHLGGKNPTCSAPEFNAQASRAVSSAK